MNKIIYFFMQINISKSKFSFSLANIDYLFVIKDENLVFKYIFVNRKKIHYFINLRSLSHNKLF